MKLAHSSQLRNLRHLLKIFLIKSFWIISWLLGICMLLLIFAFYNFQIRPFGLSKFDKHEWIQADTGSDWEQSRKEMNCLKGRMVNDLKKNYLKPGITTKREVLELLGYNFNSHFNRQTNCLRYCLGFCTFGVDYEFLNVCFNEEDTVKEVYTSRWQP